MYKMKNLTQTITNTTNHNEPLMNFLQYGKSHSCVFVWFVVKNMGQKLC